MNHNLEDLNIVICGQLVTSRTETIEEYLKDRTKALGVIGIAGVFAAENVSRCSLYEKGNLKKEFQLASILIKKRNAFTPLFLVSAFILYFFSIIKASFKFKKKFDVFIGAACFPTFVGMFLKKIGKVKQLIYYCIDYYPYPKDFCFNKIVVWAFRKIDKLCVKNSDITWHISKQIPGARSGFEGIDPNSYHHIVVPLCYNSNLLRIVPFEKIERWTIGFIGTLSPNQGLQLLIEVMPEVLRQLPELRVKIIGRGPYGSKLKKLVEKENLDNIFEFLGFIKDENRVLDILSHCTVGVALWLFSKDDNIYYADTGKPKLYAFCGLPIIITKGPAISYEIERRKAGIAIDYDKESLKDAILKLFKNDLLIEEYKKNSFEMAKSLTSEIILAKAFKECLRCLI